MNRQAVRYRIIRASTQRNLLRKSLTILAVLVLLGTIPDSAVAQLYTWVGGSGFGEYYDVSDNWNPSTGPPDPNETALFNDPNSYEVWWDDITGNRSVKFLDVQDGDVTFLNVETDPNTLAQYELIINGSGGSGSSSDLAISGAGTQLTIDGIHLHSLGGAEVLSGATLVVDGSLSAGSTLTVDGSVGLQNDGTLNVLAGGVVNATNSYLRTGDATVTGIDATGIPSTWYSDFLKVGYQGDGTLSITSGGLVSDLFGDVGSGVGSTGIVTVDGTDPNGNPSTWHTATFLNIGSDGDGVLQITNGGLVSSNAGSSIGQLGGSVGLVTVAGTNFGNTPSTWLNANSLSVGFSGDGTLQISGGGLVSNTFGHIGRDAGSTGAVTVDGTDSNGNPSQWENSNDLYVGENGNGTLEITGGGQVSNTSGYVGYDPNSSGAITVDGADPNGNPSTWSNSGGLYVGLGGNGTLEITAGGLVSSADGYIGFDTGSVGTLTVDSADPNDNPSTWNNTTNLYVGEYGDGTLEITGGGLFTSGNDTFIAHQGGSNGVVTVAGTSAAGTRSTWINSGDLHLGGEYLSDAPGGTGMFEISGGGLVSNSTARIAISNASTFTVSVDGTDANGNPSTWNNSADLCVGDDGNGILNITGGGLVSNAVGVIAFGPGSTGAVTVDGTDPSGNPSIWDNTLSLSVGKSGDGALNITGGGQVSNTTGYVGYDPNSSGAITVDGTDPNGNPSTWDNSAELFVAYNGVGSLGISGGGLVTTTSFAFIGYQAGSTGVATIAGTDANGSPSTWDNSLDLFVGLRGDGTLGIADGGLVSNAVGIIAYDSGSTGSVTVDGANANGSPSTWNNSSNFYVGHDGDGTLEITGGGLVTNVSGRIGFHAGSTGVATIDGTDPNGNPSTWSNSSHLFVGGGSSGEGGTGVLAVINQALVEVGGTLKIWSPGTVSLDGGSIVTQSFDNTAGGTFNFLSGSLTINDGITIGSDPKGVFPSSTTLNSDRYLTTPATTTISPFRTLTLDGGSLTTGDLDIQGTLAFNSGTLRITGASGLTIGASGPFGSSLSLGIDQNLEVNNTVNVNPGATLSLVNGGNLAADTIANNGLIRGTGTLNGPLTNYFGAEVFLSFGNQINGTSFGNLNYGQLTLAGGTIHFDGDLQNESLIVGNGTLRADSGIYNNGTMALSATTNVLGYVANGGEIIISGGTTTFYDGVSNFGEIRTSQNSYSVYFGSYSGNGDTGPGTVIMEGDVHPGMSPASVAFAGDLIFSNHSSLAIELGGTLAGIQYDQVLVAGAATLNGTLELSLLDGFTPSVGNSFQILTAGDGLSGAFSDVLLPELEPLLAWEILPSTNEISLLVVPKLPGDFDVNGVVDGKDFLLFQRGGSPRPFSSLDEADWEVNYGAVASLSANAENVPEPAAWMLAGLTWLFGTNRDARRIRTRRN